LRQGKNQLSTEQGVHPAEQPDQGKPASHARQRTGVRVLVWLIILLIFGAGFGLVLQQRDTAKTTRAAARFAGAVTTTVATAKKGNIGNYLDSIGTVTPVYTSSITSQVNGIVTQVHYREGQLVRKGDPLIDIDPRPYEANLLQAQGTLERDQNVLAQAQMDLERYKDAWARRAIPKQTLDDQVKMVAQDQGTVKLDQGTVQYDQVQVGFCHITAPIDGRVGLRLVDPGNVVQSNGTAVLVVITQIEPITVIFTIAEDNLSSVQEQLHHNAKLTVDAYDRAGLKKIASGTLMTIDNLIDTTTGTVKARANFANKDAALFPNEFVNVQLLVNTISGATLIPSAAVQHNGKQAFVYVVQSDVAHMRNVTTGVTNEGLTQVTGVNPGDVVATSSFDKLQENSKIAVSTTPLPSSENSPGSTSP
jgi:membrane fusion protein, multidrug efflux system